MEKGRFHIAGAILGCLTGDPDYNKRKWNLEETEDFRPDSWIASVRTKVPLTEQQLHDFFDVYTLDPDRTGIPYFLAVKDIETGGIFVLFNDEYVFYPLNTAEERLQAYEIGIKKGLLADQVDFHRDTIKPDEFYS